MIFLLIVIVALASFGESDSELRSPIMGFLMLVSLSVLVFIALGQLL